MAFFVVMANFYFQLSPRLFTIGRLNFLCLGRFFKIYAHFLKDQKALFKISGHFSISIAVTFKDQDIPPPRSQSHFLKIVGWLFFRARPLFKIKASFSLITTLNIMAKKCAGKPIDLDFKNVTLTPKPLSPVYTSQSKNTERLNRPLT